MHPAPNIEGLKPASHSIFIIGVLAASLALAASGCASRGAAAGNLADAGLHASSVLARDVTGLARRLNEGDVANAFSATWAACAEGATCKAAMPSADVQRQRAELAAAVELRAQTVEALYQSYSALQAEVRDRPGAGVERLIERAVSTAWTYAASLAGRRSSSSPRLSLPLERSASFVVSVSAARAREDRLRRSNQELREAVATVHEALVLETALYDALAEALVREKIEAHKALLQAGLVSAADALRPVAGGLRLNLVRDADAVIAKSPAARLAVEAAVEASERAEIRKTQSRYRAAISALAELEHLHHSMAEGKSMNFAELGRTLSILDRLAIESSDSTQARLLADPSSPKPVRDGGTIPAAAASSGLPLEKLR